MFYECPQNTIFQTPFLTLISWKFTTSHIFIDSYEVKDYFLMTGYWLIEKHNTVSLYLGQKKFLVASTIFYFFNAVSFLIFLKHNIFKTSFDSDNGYFFLNLMKKYVKYL